MNRLRLRKQTRTPSPRPGEIQVFQDSDETLKQVDEEGTVTALGGGESPGGSQPGALVWTLGKSIGFAEWNAGGVIDVTTLETGTLLYDIFVVASDDFDDSYPSADMSFGWGLAGASPRRFGASTGHFPVLGGYVSDGGDPAEFVPAGVSGGLDSTGSELVPQSAMANDNTSGQYGPPVLIKDSVTAGPLQASPNANGDAAAGSVKVWLLTATLEEA